MSFARNNAAAATLAVAMLEDSAAAAAAQAQAQAQAQQASSSWTFCRSCIPAMPIPGSLAVRLSPCGCCLCKDCMILFMAETRMQKNWHCSTCNQAITAMDACMSSTQKKHGFGHNDNNNNNNMAAATVAAATVGQGNTLRRVTIRPTLQAAGGEEAQVKRRAAPVAAAAAAAAKTGAKRKRAPAAAKAAAKAGVAAAAAASDPEQTTTTSGPGRKKRGRNKGFDERMRALVQFKKQFGHVYVPSNFKDDNGLYEWVKNVRSGNKNLTDDQRDALTAVGFVWEKDSVRRDRMWLESLDKLMAYKSRFGDCAVPWRWKEDVPLAEWVHTQRKKNSTGQLKPHRKEILESVGFEWAGKKGKRVDM